MIKYEYKGRSPQEFILNQVSGTGEYFWVTDDWDDIGGNQWVCASDTYDTEEKAYRVMEEHSREYWYELMQGILEEFLENPALPRIDVHGLYYSGDDLVVEYVDAFGESTKISFSKEELNNIREKLFGICLKKVIEQFD